ncbi:MAG: cation-translocating P-type ATPase [Bacillota bacterium]
MANVSAIPSGEGPAGLTEGEVLKLREKHGKNLLPQAKPPSPLLILLQQFKSPLIFVILGAALVSLSMGETKDFAIIMAVVVFDVALGFLQEYQATRTYQSLQSMVKPTATVIRGGQRKDVEAWELVPGDVVIIGAGDRAPADGRLLEARSLSVNESMLTGESESVLKREGDPVFMGTTVSAGRGIFEVAATGRSTKLGEIASSIVETPEGDTPLQKRLAAFSRQLTKLVMGLTAVMYAVGVATGKDPVEMVRVAIILAVAAIPEGLLIAVTVILVLGMKRVFRRQGLVKRLLAVETLGSVTVICTDKTGTLTEGQMQVTDWEFADPGMALYILALNNNLEDSMEVALWDLARKQGGEDPEDVVKRCPRLDEEPFSSEKKYMTTVNQIGDARYLLLKGAPEVVIERCDMPAAERDALLARFDSWARKGLRLLGLCYKKDDEASGLHDGQANGYTWGGLVGLMDPVRKEVPGAIATCVKAGVQVKMITGDHRLTAERIARLVGLDVDPSRIVEGKDLDLMDDAELRARVKDIVVFARILPHQKLRIVSALQAVGEVVAMVGDGVNDAPALKKSDIGVVVGTATEVAKETADLVLLDCNFKTIVAAIEEGRLAFQNIKKVVSYTLSNSFAEILLVFVSMLLGWPAPLAVAQILWIHLICDGPVDIVLGFEPMEEGIMDEKPRPVSEPILGGLGLWLIAAISMTAAAGCLAMFGHFWLVDGDFALARTLAFETLAVISLVYVFAYRSMRRGIFHMGHFTANKPLLVSVLVGFVVAFVAVLVPSLRDTLGAVRLDLQHWLLIFGLSFLLLLIVEAGKYVALTRSVKGKGSGSPSGLLGSADGKR